MASLSKKVYYFCMCTSERTTEEFLEEFRQNIAKALVSLTQEEACGEIADTILEKLRGTYFETINIKRDTDFLTGSFWREVHSLIVAEEEINSLVVPTDLSEMQTNEYILAEELQKIGRSAKKASQVIIQMRLRKKIYMSILSQKHAISGLLDSG